MRMNRLNEILAYKRINHKPIKKKINFNLLYQLIKKLNDPIFIELKILMILTVHWHFDYLAKTYQNPKKLDKSLSYWFEIFSIFSNLSKHNWIIREKKKNTKIDIWKQTRKSFNYMWPKTTEKSNYDASAVMAELRVNQIMKKILKSNYKMENKVILDSGCGPGRYIEKMLKFKPKQIIGIDSGFEIIKKNKKKFKNLKNIKFIKANINKLPIKNKKIDILISAGVLHHVGHTIESLVKDHARVIKDGGHFFVFIVGKGGQELDLWKFCRKVMRNIDIKEVFLRLKNNISPLRIQGILDHSYGEYIETSRIKFEKILIKYFRKIEKIDGIYGADVTVKTFKKDRYFKKRFGTGNLRYLCVK